MESSQHRRLARRSTARVVLYAALAALASLFLYACEPSPASKALADRHEPAPDAGPILTTAIEIETADDAVAVNDDAEENSAPGSASVETRPVSTITVSEIKTAKLPKPRNPGDIGPPVTPQPDFVVDSDATTGFELLGKMIPAGTSQRLMWSASQIFEGVSSATPVLVVNGSNEGPVLCLTAAIHGDELNGIEMVRRVLHELDPKKVNGTVIGIPIVNLQGFRRGSRYLPDRRDLNRYFPGNAQGSSAARIAHSLFESIIQRCDALVDLHTGSFYRTNMPQLRADLRYAKIKELTLGFGGIAVLHSEAAVGTLRRAATDAGIPAITLEAGEPLRLQSAKVSQGVTGIFTLLDTLEIVNRVQFLSPPAPIYYRSTWVRADDGGILFSVVRLGQEIEIGDVLGTVTDPITNNQALIYSPAKGRVLGMALNQVVQPGFAAFRIGIETDDLPTGPPVGGDLAWAGESRVLGDNSVTAEEAEPGPAANANPEVEENSEE